MDTWIPGVMDKTQASQHADGYILATVDFPNVEAASLETDGNDLNEEVDQMIRKLNEWQVGHVLEWMECDEYDSKIDWTEIDLVIHDSNIAVYMYTHCDMFWQSNILVHRSSPILIWVMLPGLHQEMVRAERPQQMESILRDLGPRPATTQVGAFALWAVAWLNKW